MDGWSANNSASRAQQVWAQLLDCYGESLIRKFDSDEPPPAWVTAIGSLNDYQLRQGMRRLIVSGKPHPPALPEFMKLCRTVGHADDVPDTRPTQTHPVLADQRAQDDPWGWLANRRLLKHITTVVPKDPKCYGERDTPPFVRNVNILVAFKNRWADLMRQSATEEGVPIQEQEQSWNECIRMAEEQIKAETP